MFYCAAQASDFGRVRRRYRSDLWDRGLYYEYEAELHPHHICAYNPGSKNFLLFAQPILEPDDDVESWGYRGWTHKWPNRSHQNRLHMYVYGWRYKR